MKKNIYYLSIVLGLSVCLPAQARQLNASTQNALSRMIYEGINDSEHTSDREGKTARNPTSAAKTYYVSANGKTRADGLSKESPLKDLQKAIDLAEDGSTILVAEGNYLGNMDRGYIECGRFGNGADNGKFLKFYGGYASDFSERNPLKYITKIQPNEKSPRVLGSALFHITARRAYGDKTPAGEVVVDGFTFDGGELIIYNKADVKDPRTGTPNTEVLTGMLVHPDGSPIQPSGYSKADWRALHLTVEGKVRVSNCVFVNCRFLDFHHNTVLFTWPITKEFESMGQGFRFMNGIRTINVYKNIFGFNSRCGVERCRYEARQEYEKLKQSNLYDNYFIGNKYDLEICTKSNPLNVPASRIEEAEVIGPKYEGNKEMPLDKRFIGAIDAPYLEGFMSLKIVSSENYDRNSTANQVNRYLGKISRLRRLPA